jgi:hypothetical protein
MGFSTVYCKNVWTLNAMHIHLSYTVWQRVGLTGLLMALLSLFSAPAWALNEIVTLELQYKIQDNRLVMNSQTQMTLPESLIDALHHEIPLTFTTEIQLLQHTSLLGIAFNRHQKTIRYQTQLYATGFNRRYVLYNSRNKKVQSFNTLKSALEAFGTLQDFMLVELKTLNMTRPHTLKMRIGLNRWQLPAPLILNTLFEPDWQISSGWFSVPITHTAASQTEALPMQPTTP